MYTVGFEIIYSWVNGMDTSDWHLFREDAIHEATMTAAATTDDLYNATIVDCITGEVIWEW